MLAATASRGSHSKAHVFKLDQEDTLENCPYCGTDYPKAAASPHFLYPPYPTYIKPRDMEFTLRTDRLIPSSPEESRVEAKTLCRGRGG